MNKYALKFDMGRWVVMCHPVGGSPWEACQAKNLEDALGYIQSMTGGNPVILPVLTNS